MQLVQTFKSKSIGRRTIIVLTAITFTTAAATEVLAAGRGGGHGSGAFGGAHMGSEFRGPLLDSVPSMRPVFNPSAPYTVPQSPETPVSPASPGAIFGNG
jgi:hypothetical protein